MKFSGLQKISLIDFPDRISTVLFTPGCNLRCPYCHNWRIVIDPRPPFLNQKKVIQMLEKQKKFVDAVVVTGGEPTLHRELPTFMEKLHEKGFTIKLDTNGFFPQILKECLPFASYIALDVKTCKEKYGLLGAKDLSGFLRSVEILKSSELEYEFRATVVPSFVDEEDIPEIGEIVKGGKRFAFQQFVPDDTLDKKFRDVKIYTRDTILRFTKLMKQNVDEVLLRVQ